MKHFSFERDIIDAILKTIKKHQVYLTQPENLPQLAKLGYMYNTLWYSGRICYGSDGIIRRIGKYGNCEENPKYKIEMCEPQSSEIEDLIYDAWGMHVTNDMQPSWEAFKNIVEGNKQYSAWETLYRKPNKTFDEWAEALMNPEYEYTYKSRRDVANHLLCTNGTGYGYKDGYIIYEASGADQDIDLYGFWEQAKFREDIQKIVDKLMFILEVEQCVQAAHEYILKIKKEKENKDLIGGKTHSEFMHDLKERMEKMKQDEPERFKKLTTEHPSLFGEYADDYAVPYYPYYPISEYPYSNISAVDKNTHPSYIQAGIEICEDILAHKKEENAAKYRNGGNVKFAKNFLKKFKPQK